MAVTGAAGTPNAWMTVSAAGHSLVAIVRERHDDASGNAGDPFARLRWANRLGEFVGDLGDTARYWTLRLAPDGRRAITNFGDNSLWLLEGGSRRVPLTPRDANLAFGAVWAPDGKEIAFTQEASAGIGVERLIEPRGDVGRGVLAVERPTFHLPVNARGGAISVAQISSRARRASDA